MTVSANDAHPFPIYGARFRLLLPLFDNDGDLVASASGLDSERSIDCGTFADCSNEATQIATSSAMYYLDLIYSEMTSKSTAVIVKTSSTDAKTTPIVLNPIRMPVLDTGTAQAGASSTITLKSGSSAQDGYYIGMYVNITNNSPSNAQGQARKIISYVGSTKVATVEAAWGTNPSSASTYEILVPDVMLVGGFLGRLIPDPNTVGVPKVDLLYILGTLLTETAGQIAGGFKKLFDVASPVFDLLSVKQTGDSYARVGAPVGASISADIAAVKTVADAVQAKTDALPADPADQSLIIAATDSILADTDDIQSRLPAALTGAGNMKSDVLAINGSTAAALVQALAVIGIEYGTCASGSSTSVVNTNLTEATDDHYLERSIVFTTGALAKQQSRITAYNGTTKAISVSPSLSEAPADTDAFVIA